MSNCLASNFQRYPLLLWDASMEVVWLLPSLQRFSSASSLWMVSFIDLFFSFSFSYFFFHCSAVSSRFTDTVFLMVLALIRGMQWQSDRERGGGKVYRRVRGGWEEEIQKGGGGVCERTVVKRGTVNRGISASAAQWEWVCISLIGMQIGFLPTVCHGANTVGRGRHTEFKTYKRFRPLKMHSRLQKHSRNVCGYKLFLTYDPNKWHHRVETLLPSVALSSGCQTTLVLASVVSFPFILPSIHSLTHARSQFLCRHFPALSFQQLAVHLLGSSIQ